MSIAQILFEQYKVLPKKVKTQLKTLIDSEDKEKIDISLPALKEAIREVKSLHEGKAKTSNAREFLAELEKELSL
jgi:hypothetical protein